MIEYYNVTQEGFTMVGLNYGMIALLIAGATFVRINYSKLKRQQQVFSIIWMTVVSMMTLASFFVSYSKYRSSIEVMSDQLFEEVEGLVKNFDPQSPEGNQPESFTVRGVHFNISHYDWCACFKQTKAHGGPIRRGKYVRIRHYRGEILQLWLRSP